MEVLLSQITDSLDDGVICVDAEGTITLFNRKARETVGGDIRDGRSHPAGTLEPGDIVLLADNMLGDDDGELVAGDLAVLGIHDPDLRPGDAFLAAGVYQNDAISPIYRPCGQLALPPRLELRETYQGLDLLLAIDQLERKLIIQVGAEDYSLSYYKSLGNMVVVDGATGAVKFFQSRGSTLRREDEADLLRGGSFAAKGRGAAQPDLVGQNLFDLFLPGKLTQLLSGILDGNQPPVSQENCLINNRPMLVSIQPIVRGGATDGAVIGLTDLSEMESLLRERNEFIARVERSNLNVNNYATHVPPYAFGTFAGSAPPIQRVKYLAYRASQATCNVILTGESGTGKSQLAHEIHNLSRPGRPFVEVNCASIPHDLFESELFGYVGGAFTGALTSGKAGYFEQAQGGTLFLDELAELPPDIQVKLLYVIQNKRFYRVGSAKPVEVDVRILCATNKDLREEVRQGRFREDLYYRVNVFPIQIPPLRERITDIYLLSKSLTERSCADYGLPPKQLSAKALDKMLAYDWPGNIRELSNVIERAITVTDGPIIYPDAIQLDADSGAALSAEAPAPTPAPPSGPRPLKDLLADTERAALQAALLRHGGDKNAAMEELGLKKTVFYEKLRRYDIRI